MRKTLRISLMVIVLACSTSAGVMPNGTPDTPPPPPPPPELVSVAQAPAGGIQETPADGDLSGGAENSLTQIVLNLFKDISSLF